MDLFDTVCVCRHSTCVSNWLFHSDPFMSGWVAQKKRLIDADVVQLELRMISRLNAYH